MRVMETLRALLHRHADELAEVLTSVQTPAPKAKTRRTSRSRAPTAPAELPISDEERERLRHYLQGKGL